MPLRADGVALVQTAKKRGKGYCKLRLSVECTFATLIARRHERVFFVPIATKP